MDTGEDRFPSTRKVVYAVTNAEDFPVDDVERIEIQLTASGEATWRAYRRRDDEPVGGYLSADDLAAVGSEA